MSQTITIQLPTHIAEQMSHEARKQNISVESLALQSLQKEYGCETTQEPSPDLEQFFDQLRNAIDSKQPTVQVALHPLHQMMADSLKNTGILLDYQTSSQTLTLEINPQQPGPPLDLIKGEQHDIPTDPALLEIMNGLKDDDSDIRSNALQSLIRLYDQQS